MISSSSDSIKPILDLARSFCIIFLLVSCLFTRIIIRFTLTPCAINQYDFRTLCRNHWWVWFWLVCTIHTGLTDTAVWIWNLVHIQFSHKNHFPQSCKDFSNFFLKEYYDSVKKSHTISLKHVQILSIFCILTFFFLSGMREKMIKEHKETNTRSKKFIRFVDKRKHKNYNSLWIVMERISDSWPVTLDRFNGTTITSISCKNTTIDQ